MTAHDDPDEPGALTITWREVDTPDLLEARLMVGDDGNGVYVGYMVRRLGNDTWKGYVGVNHTLARIGLREVVQAAVEQAARGLDSAAASGRSDSTGSWSAGYRGEE